MSFPQYPRNQESGVAWLGAVPEHWEIVPGRRLFAQKREPARPEDMQLSATQRFGVVPQELFMEREEQKVVLALSGTENFKHIERGDFVISLRSFQGGIEHSAYAGCVSPAYTVLRPRRTICASFWAYALKSSGFISELQSVTAGIREGKSIGYGQFGQLALPLAPLHEQQAIAAFLDHEIAKVDALIVEQLRLIALLKEKRQAIISHAMTKGLDLHVPMRPSGVEWFGEVPEHWSLTKLKDLALREQSAFTNGPFGSDLLTEELVEEGVPVVYISDLNTDGYAKVSRGYISPAKAEELNRFRVDSGDLLIAKVGNPPGFSCVYPSEEVSGVICQDVIRLRPDVRRALSEYLSLFLNSRPGIEAVDAICVEATRKRFSLEDLKGLRIPLPPIAEQRDIVIELRGKLSGLARLESAAFRVTELLRERRTALISAAVTGKIDVRHLADAEAA